jgi:hypothetical protein
METTVDRNITKRLSGSFIWKSLLCVAVAFAVFACSPDAMAQSAVKKGSVCTVHFVDGAPMKFNINKTGTESSIKTIMSNVKKGVSWMLELDGKTVIIPMANVRYIEISPALMAPREPIIQGTQIK